MGKNNPVLIDEVQEPPGPSGSVGNAYLSQELNLGEAQQSVTTSHHSRPRAATKNLALKARPSANRPHIYNDAAQFINETRPSNPVHFLRTHVLRGAAQWFLRNFPGTVLYAGPCGQQRRSRHRIQPHRIGR